MQLFSWLLGNPVDSEKINKQGVRIDVRSEEECRAGMVAGAKNIPLEVLLSEIAKVVKDKNELIGVYCKSGMRSEVAKQKLKAAGYKNVWNEGGYWTLKRKLED